jgi:hypothetical protein
MGLLDTLLGRTKPVRANLDALFALPSAAVTLQVRSGLVPTGRAGVCFKPPAGQPFAEMQAELEQLLQTPDDATTPAPTTGSAPGEQAGAPGTTPATLPGRLAVRHVGDKFGYRWIVVESATIDDLVTRVHMVHASLQDAGWSTQLLCSVFGFTPGTGDATEAGSPAVTGPASPETPPGAADNADDLGIDVVTRPLYLVYLAKRGTFYPFAPTGDEQRDNELELRIRAVVADDLPVEQDLSRWFPLWDLPIA